MEPITGSEAADRLLIIVGAVMALANAITMFISNRPRRKGLAMFAIAFLDVLAGNIHKNQNYPYI